MEGEEKKKLIESENEYQILFEKSPISIWVKDFSEVKRYLDSINKSSESDIAEYFKANPMELEKCISLVRIIDVNEKTIEMYQASKKEDFFSNHGVIFTQDSVEAFKKGIISFASGKTKFESEAIDKTLKNEILAVQMNIEIVPGFENDWSKVILCITNITESKKVAEKLKESEEKYRLLADNINDIIWTMDLNLNTTYVSPSVNSVLGYTIQEDMAMSINDKFTPDSLKKIANIVKEQIKPKNINNQNYKTTYTLEVEQYHKDGSIVPTEVKVNPMRDENGIAIGLVGITRNITERKKAEQKSRESEEKMRAIFESMDQVIYISDPNTYQILYVNKKTNELFPGDIIGKKCYNVFQNLDSPCSFCTNDKLFGENPISPYIWQFHNEKIDSWFHIIDKAIEWDDGRKVRFEMAIDITEQKKAEQKLKESEEKYREAYNLVIFYKDLFTHDMNNILQGILSTAEYYSLLQNDPEKLKSFGDISELIKMHVGRGASLISKVRTLSKLEETEINLRPIIVNDVLSNSVENTKKSFHEKNVNVTIKGISRDIKILGDDFLIDIFDNLLNNALKFSDEINETIVDITVSKIQADDIKYIKFEFKDNGIGIPDDRKKTLFQGLFERDKSKRGMGIGLSLVKKVVDKYEGKIWVEDRIKGNYKEGSNFVLLLKESP